MAIFGTIDAKALATDVSVTNGSTTVTTTGDFTDRDTADFIQNGDILSLAGVQYTVLSVTSATTLSLTIPYAGTTGTVSAANAVRRTAPKEVANLLLNENAQGNKFGPGTQFLFIDDTEAQLTENKIRGLKWPGWWTYRTYADGDGNTRHKAECIAFANQTAANAGDFDNDNPAADLASTITISSQPTDQTTFAPAGAILSVDTIGAADGDRTEGTYTIDVSDYTTDGDGTGATFTVVVDGSGAATVTVDDAGSGFIVGETITIDDADLGGGGAANLTFDVATVATAAATFAVIASVTTGSLIYQWQVQTATATTRWTDISNATSDSLALTALTTADSGKKFRVKIGGTAGGQEVISNIATLTVTAA
jgi:hypothetical protein